MVKKMEKDFCVKCGAEDIREQETEIHIPLSNPHKIAVSQVGSVCHECGDAYFSLDQIKELSDKIEVEKSKH